MTVIQWNNTDCRTADAATCCTYQIQTKEQSAKTDHHNNKGDDARMQTFRFVTMNKTTVTCWCETNQLAMFRDFMQFVLDNMRDPKKFLLWDTKQDKVYNMYQIATEVYDMRKRTFAERMSHMHTGKWADIPLPPERNIPS